MLRHDASLLERPKTASSIASSMTNDEVLGAVLCDVKGCGGVAAVLAPTLLC